MPQKRNRFKYILLMGIVIILGLLSRTPIIPEFIYPYLGDILYALLIYLFVGFLFPAKSSKWVLVAAISFCYIIEISQFYHAPWIDSIRNTILGSLILGFRFLWSDLFAYGAGVAIGFMLEKRILLKHIQQKAPVKHPQ
ncbi:DUF2809 domain-containing protein [Chondrinema litorale]|uniref:ribosomal maturation YjgA family protein n=1 Tax=Chondrinema litorale TaxID=2994555 RepID=UPI002542DCE0|nr:DUF2809 domain-containing protein [Chondrinema litorale]UZR97871.1 DUF2809 domain-containing protein [Chondrinema litorale]